MLNLIAFGIAAGAGVQALRAWPASHPVTADAVTVALITAVVCAYLGGRWHGRHNGKATAVAVASAEATAVASNQVNLAVNIGHDSGAGRHSAHMDAMPWLDAVVVRPDNDALAAALDGTELQELFDQREVEDA